MNLAKNRRNFKKKWGKIYYNHVSPNNTGKKIMISDQ